jgi:hypothetical protein
MGSGFAPADHPVNLTPRHAAKFAAEDGPLEISCVNNILPNIQTDRTMGPVI